MYRIKNWDRVFENNRTRDMKSMRWIPIPNDFDGYGYSLIMNHPKGAEIYGAWVACVGVASKSEPRGTLMRNKETPHTAESISLITRIPLRTIKLMLDFCHKQCKWLILLDSHGGAEFPQETAQKGREWKGREGNRKEGKNLEYRPISELLKKRVLETKQMKITDSTLNSWDNDCRLMVERDNRDIDDIAKLINECHDMPVSSSGFSWKNNILSMGTLRNKWNDGKIHIGMVADIEKGSNSGAVKKDSYQFERNTKGKYD